jgi:hypothetical protein
MNSLLKGTSVLKFDTYEFDENKIREAINNFKKEVSESEIISKEDKNIISATEFEINVVGDRLGTLYRYSFVWVGSKELYYLLAGKKVDGSIFLTKMINVEYKPVYNIDVSDIDNIDFTKGEAHKAYLDWCDNDTKRWGNDIEDFKQYLEELEEENKYVEVEDRLFHYPQVDNKCLKVHEGLVLEQNTREYNLTKLRAEIDVWVTEEMLLTAFSKFNTDPKIYRDYKTNTPYKYPLISIFIPKDNKFKNKKIAIIQFSKSKEHSTDASFAKLMRRQTKFFNPQTNTISNSFFSFWKNNYATSEDVNSI